MDSTFREKLLIRSPNWLGDAIMTLPAVGQMVRAAKANAQPLEIHILTPPKLADLWRIVAGISGILTTSAKLSDTIQRIRTLKPTSALIFPNSWRTALEMFLARVPRRIGYHGHFGRRLLLTHTCPKEESPTPRHQALDYLDLARHAGFDINSVIAPPPLNSIGPSLMDSPYLAVCPGAEYGPAKRWPADRFAASARALAEERGWKMMLLGARGDQAVAEEVERALEPGTRVNLTGKTSLSEFIRYLAHAELVLCNDSGSMHLAALLQRPAVAIFGSTEPLLTGPISPSVQVLRHPVECSPCFLRECPIDLRCMMRIEADHVIEAAHRALTV